MSLKKENKSGKRNYLTGKEIRAIAKENAKVMKRLEAYKYRKAEESEYLTQMNNDENILEIEDLHTYFFTEQGVVKAVNGVSIDVPKNMTVGIVGESGCGKSVTSMSVMRLLQGPQGQIYSGKIRFKAIEQDGTEKVYDIAKMPMSDIYKIRGNQIAMMFPLSLKQAKP
ncbi:MAG: ATP-binding cassette domain-containing protein [Lachnospiraceae bacterium]|nr:ATP-binding cassette domain-containing protein [Lachnospiraceae bacterium]